jgi:serine/threonine-protein kinase
MEAGQTIAGKYRLNRLLGTGGMATVWSATNVFTEREFAVKFMLPQVARTPEAARRFLLEAKVSARINHPNIIEVIDVGQAEDGSLFLVMELLTGVSLDVAVRRQQPPMSLHDFLGIMKEVAVALSAAHRSGVIHRDLKPTNVFLHKDRDGRVVPKVLDFGVSKILEEEANTALTMVGTVLGSPLYMSPEQAMGAAGIDGRTDVFAFGSILFESLSGQRAFDAPNFNALIVTIATKQPKSLDEVAPNLPEGVRKLVSECMVTDKNKRIASVDLIVERLAAILPDLEKSELHLPSQYGVERSSDPDATNALPVMRKSDRPPQPAVTLPAGHPSPLAMQITNPPPPKKPLEMAAAWLQNAEKYAHQMPPRHLAVAAGGGGAIVVLVIVGLAAAFTRGPARTPAPATALSAPSSGTAPTTAASTGPGTTPATDTAGTGTANVPSADESADVPTYSIDSLPVAAARGAPGKGNGRLSIVASPGWCAVIVDGQRRGVTPLNAFELPAGAHKVECVPPNRPAKTAMVNVAEGTAAHFKFALDE